jgi:amidase
LADDDIESVIRSARDYGATISGQDYLASIEVIHAYGRQLAGFFETYDILLSATLAEPPAKVGRFGHHRTDYLEYRMGQDGVFAYSPYCAAFNASGQPAASVPLYWNGDNLPIGVHLAARFGADEDLMSLCADLEHAAPWFHKRPPISV